MSEPLLVVDGHNALFGLARFADAHQQSSASARLQLVDWLSRFQTESDFAVVVVFDGKGTAQSTEGGEEGEALVIYSGGSDSADSVIERLAMSQAKKRRVIVASNDRLIAHGVMNSGAEAIRLEGLEDMIESAGDSWRKSYGVS